MKHCVIIVCLLLLGGCVQVEKIGLSLKYQVQGSHYLQTGDYRSGEELFRQSVTESPESSLANFYLGRFLLGQKKEKEALAFLKKAAAFDSGDPDFAFWLGIAYGENGFPAQERQMYETALALDPDHLQSLIYLGHLQLKGKEYRDALTSYDKALKIWPLSPSALYNRALVLKILGRTPEEKLAWLVYLSHYPAGGLARRATDHLNMLSDFSYRNHTIGTRTVTLAKIRFKPFGAELDSSSFPSLKLVGAIVSNMGKGRLQIVVYQKNNKMLARQRALSVKSYLQKTFPDLGKGRLAVSWFSEPEEFRVAGKKLSSDESVRFFLTY